MSDFHWAGPAEQARSGHETRVIKNPALRWAASAWRRWVWLAEPHRHNDRVQAICDRAGPVDRVLANGDFTLDSGFVGASDPAALASSAECLAVLRQTYGSRLLTTIGDHDLGKTSLFGGAGGLRRRSLEQCELELGLRRFWVEEVSPGWLFVGVTSSLVAWPMFELESLPEERDWWRQQHAEHLAAISGVFQGLGPGQQIVLCCHDPSALPFLYRETVIRERLGRVALTLIGHLHSRAILRAARGLAGCPRVTWLGVTARRYTTALRDARCWRDFRVDLCPSPAGIQLLKDGGWLTVDLDRPGSLPVVGRHRLGWEVPRG